VDATAQMKPDWGDPIIWKTVCSGTLIQKLRLSPSGFARLRNIFLVYGRLLGIKRAPPKDPAISVKI
jgi:hypothetical protein